MFDRQYLDVPYYDTQEAKKLGARFDPKERRWYVREEDNIKPFFKWIPYEDGNYYAWDTHVLAPPIYLLCANEFCPVCGEGNPIVAIGSEGAVECENDIIDDDKWVIHDTHAFTYIRELPKVLADYLTDVFPQYFKDENTESGESLYFNHCFSCGSIVPDFQAHYEDYTAVATLLHEHCIVLQGHGGTGEIEYHDVNVGVDSAELSKRVSKAFNEVPEIVLRITQSQRIPRRVRPQLSTLERDKLYYYSFNLQLDAGLGFINSINIEFDYQPEVQKIPTNNDLFKAIFNSDEAKAFWHLIEPYLSKLHIRVNAQSYKAVSLPWESWLNPATNRPVVAECLSFSRTISFTPYKQQHLALAKSFPVRVLMVVARGREDEIPYDAIFNQIFLEGLQHISHGNIEFDLMQYGSFREFCQRIRTANNRGVPYHIVHFDGHGHFDENSKQRGSIYFDQSSKPYYGNQIGELLKSNNVLALFLNACSSAKSVIREAEVAEAEKIVFDTDYSKYPSLAHEIMQEGLISVLAMNKKVSVATAQAFYRHFYSNIALGTAVELAVTLARKELFEREWANKTDEKNEWGIPVYYQARSFRYI